jgi:hypothetical protein
VLTNPVGSLLNLPGRYNSDVLSSRSKRTAHDHEQINDFPLKIANILNVYFFFFLDLMVSCFGLIFRNCAIKVCKQFQMKLAVRDF